MTHIGIFYGSSTGNTQDAAKKIAKALSGHAVELFDVATAQADFSAYDLVLFGSSTWGLGDLQDDWDAFVEEVKSADLAGKKVALFGTGDSSSYSDTFGEALGKIYGAIKGKGIQLIGQVPTEGYSFDSSESVIDGQFVGLLLDEDNEPEKTDQRIALWVDQIKKAILNI
ncbi:MAG: flavodoxin [Bacteroidales bacterium 45-6]|nr:MAG: flavodoxin [Bacteroidales bacterium 45-6]